MGLETATYISQLVPTNPTAGDQKSQGDDHLRMIKQVLQNTFPTASGPLSFGTYATKNSNFLTKTADYTQLTADNGKSIYFDMSSGSRIYNLIAAATAADGFMVYIAKDGSANTLTIDPAGSELINGAATLILGPNAFGLLICSGAAWRFFGSGTVQGPAAATVEALALFAAASGNVLKAGPAPGANGNILTSNGTVWQSSSPPAAGPTQALQVELEAESAVAKYISPDRIKFFPGAIKAAVTFVGATGVVLRSYNNSPPINRAGVGLYTWGIGNDFSDANAVVVGTVWAIGGGLDPTSINITGQSSGTVVIETRHRGGGLVDPPRVNLIAMGDF